MPATGPFPSLSQIAAWETAHLREAVTNWSHAADNWQDAFESVA